MTARFCAECGTPLTPDAPACRTCGTATNLSRDDDREEGSTRAPQAWRFDVDGPVPGAQSTGSTGSTGSTPQHWAEQQTIAGRQAPSTPPSSPAPSPSSPAPPRRGAGSGSRLLLALVVLVVLVAGASTVVVVLTRDGDPSNGGTQAADVPTGDSATRSASSGPTRQAAPQVTCWNGARVTSLSSCTEPTGQAGLDYLFPQLAQQNCTRNPAPAQPARLIIWECDIILDGGAAAEINYSWWQTRPAASRYYENLQVTGRITDRAGVTGWYLSAGDPEVPYKAALLYDAVPYSVTLYGASDSDRQRLLDQLRMVPAEDVRGSR